MCRCMIDIQSATAENMRRKKKKIETIVCLLKFNEFLSGILPLRHVIMLSNFTKQSAHTDHEPYFSQRVLLIYGTNYICFN